MLHAYTIRNMKKDRCYNVYYIYIYITIINYYDTKTIKIKNTIEIKTQTT